MLYIVATPIGNLKDLSPRAIEVLKQSDVILCEDTRKTGRLTTEFGIETKKLSFYEQNEKERLPQVMQMLSKGQQLALVSDAGTPAISDPGYRLVRECRKCGVPVSSIPGPSAAMMAISISGLPTDKFTFCGYLSVKTNKRKEQLKACLENYEPSIVFESPHRILKTLSALAELEPAREVFLGKELTKLHEETFLLNAEELFAEFQARKKIAGEFVLVIAGVGRTKNSDNPLES